MTRGVLLFAFNSPKVDYYSMAEYTAKRVNYFLNLPVTVITDKDSVPTIPKYEFDKVIVINSDSSNNFRNDVWLNKGRYQAYELSPYDETLLIDVDYMVNSDRLLRVFDVLQDYVCHQETAGLMLPDGKQEVLSDLSFPVLWATVLGFQKTPKAKQLFDCMKMVQQNYQHYGNLYSFPTDTYRNDHALTIAHRIINGHLPDKTHILPWNLMHVWLKTNLYVERKSKYNTKYTVVYDNWKNNKIKKEYIEIVDMDFHVINKEVFLELM